MAKSGTPASGSGGIALPAAVESVGVVTTGEGLEGKGEGSTGPEKEDALARIDGGVDIGDGGGDACSRRFVRSEERKAEGCVFIRFKS